MRHVFWLLCSAGFLTVGLWAQAPQNPALAGATTATPIPDTNPFTSDSDIRAGEALFQTHCSYCHGSFGEGGRGADLTQVSIGMADAIRNCTRRSGTAFPGAEMAPVRVSDDEVWRMVAFVKRLGSRGLLEKAPGDPAAGAAGLPEIRLRLVPPRRIRRRQSRARSHRYRAPARPEVSRRSRSSRPRRTSRLAYRAVQVVLKSGQTVTGMRLNRDDLSIQLRDSRDNLRSFLMQNVEEVRYDKPSLMPAYASMNQKDLEDLIAYLHSLKGTP